jgi:hypothetical protein
MKETLWSPHTHNLDAIKEGPSLEVVALIGSSEGHIINLPDNLLFFQQP